MLLVTTEKYRHNRISFKRRETLIPASYLREDFLEDMGLKE